ncbi:uncharacterized protein T551_02662 [Pneumocystis jirovecii RU7]|uniref:Uncharacterized protein n=1 Tax=Pneumocystis jirovecii (strain RU7) TaxID=1408657 RepID=A0A0W4ZIP0_PNEJ7|nr:uncharacterized protein T551_02662 [Pneumocystis jirovecii RU7]KTW28243.1 hypothetical protein T551_02662 [Pneumocystis jirovecii RU7]
MKTSSRAHFHPPAKVNILFETSKLIVKIHTVLSQILGASMWFFILYRMKQDGPVILGLKHPWEDHKSDEKH